MPDNNDLVKQVLSQPSTVQLNSSKHESEDEDVDEIKRITNWETEEVANDFLDYFELQESTQLVDILSLRKICQKIKRNRKNGSQIKMTDYFKHIAS